ncbi:hypothetical protein KXW38_009587, partial [Aspergillus fumigatus]
DLVGVLSRDRRGRECSERDRRREVGHDAVIEREHVACDQGHAELGERRGRQRGGDDIGRDGRNAGAQQDRQQHGHDQGEEQALVAEANDPCAEDGADAGLRHHADDGADDGAGHADGERRLGAVGERVAAGSQRVAAAARDERDQDQQAHDAHHRDDLKAISRDCGNHQRKPDPEDVAQRDVGEAKRDAGAQDQRDGERKAHAAGVERGKAFEQHVDQRRKRQHQ